MSPLKAVCELLNSPLSLESSDSTRIFTRIRILFWAATSVVGFVQAWAVRFSIYPDGNSYLDIASAYLRGDYAHAVTGAWSPLLSWLIALVLRIFQPSGYWESSVLHLLNFAGLMLSLMCFEFFFARFLGLVKRVGKESGESLLGEPTWWLLGYGLFFSTALFLLTMEPTTPDVWVCVVSYLAVGLLLRLGLTSSRWHHFAALGFVLGVAYLAKSLYFPLSLIFLACAAFAGKGWRKNIPRAILAFVIFLLVAGPFVLALSRSKHRFTYGDIGKIAFAMFVNRIPQITFWHGENNSGVPKHPTREILAAPRVFEFATPLPGTYPPGYDLSYWTEGIQPHFNLTGMALILRQSVGTLFMALLIQAEFAVGLLVLLMCKERWPYCFVTIGRIWPLWLAPVIACLGYSSVLMEGRYIAPFLVFLWLAVFVAALNPPSAASRRVATAVVLAILTFTAIRTAKYFVSDLLKLGNQQNVNWQVAQSLQAIGIKPGDKISVIASSQNVHWARLAGVKVVAELPLGQDGPFWGADGATKDKVFAALASTGSRVAVVKDPPPTAKNEGWVPLGETGYYAHLMSSDLSSGPKTTSSFAEPSHGLATDK